MSKLVPGSLFHTPGLNRKFTPIPIPKDHYNIYARQSFNRHSWTPDSTVNRVYDVSHTSTNNNYRMTSRLGGYDETEFKRVPDPARHSRAFCTKNSHTHRNCYESISLNYQPGIQTNVECLSNNNQRPHTRFPVITAVNKKRHTSCQVPTEPVEFCPGMTSHIQWQHRQFSLKNSMIFHYPDMPPGAKGNLCSAEKIYNSKNLMTLKRKKYMQLLIQNSRGVHISQEYLKYMRYINQSKTAPSQTGWSIPKRLPKLVNRRYINQSKTAPLPSQTGWSIPKRLPKIVNSGESTKVNGQEQQTTDEKTCLSSEVLRKSQSDRFENSKPKIQAKLQEKDQKSTDLEQKESADEMNKKSHEHDSLLLTVKRPESGISTSSKVHETENQKSKDLEQRESADEMNKKSQEHDSRPSTLEKPETGKSTSSKGGENYQRQTKHKDGADRPKSRRGHVSPKGSVHETLQEEDQKSTNLKQGEAADEIDKKSEEHDSRSSTVLSVHEQVQRPESGKSTSSKGDENDQTQTKHNDGVDRPKSRRGHVSTKGSVHETLQEEDQKSTDLKQRDSVDEMNKKSQEHNSRPLTVESSESGKSTSSKVHETLQEDQKSKDLEQRESADEMNKKSQEHDTRPSTVKRPESGKSTSSKVQEKVQEEDQKLTVQEKLQEEEHDTRPSTVLIVHEHVERPESGKSTSSKGKGSQTQASNNEVEENKT